MKTTTDSLKETRPGLATDSSGGQVIDPTQNVLDLVKAGNQRQDDLREASDRFTASEIGHVKEMAALRSEYTNKLAEAEAKRIDAIRAVDVNAVAVASERQAAAATVLANQVAQSADALRTLVATTATAMAEQQRQSLTQITDRLTVVERSQYEGRGKQLVADPQMEKLAMLVEHLATANSTRTGFDAGKAAAIAAAGVVGGGGVAALIMNLMKG